MNFVAKKEIEVKISSSKVDFPRAGAFGSPGKVFFFLGGCPDQARKSDQVPESRQPHFWAPVF